MHHVEPGDLISVDVEILAALQKLRLDGTEDWAVRSIEQLIDLEPKTIKSSIERLIEAGMLHEAEEG